VISRIEPSYRGKEKEKKKKEKIENWEKKGGDVGMRMGRILSRA
jgi:hypothetical protein